MITIKPTNNLTITNDAATWIAVHRTLLRYALKHTAGLLRQRIVNLIRQIEEVLDFDEVTLMRIQLAERPLLKACDDCDVTAGLIDYDPYSDDFADCDDADILF